MKGFATKATLATAAALLLAGTALAQNPRPLGVGQSRDGNITMRSQRMTENDYYLDAYRISGNAGDRVAITMRSEAFDSYLEVGRMVDDVFEAVAYDDDGAGELNSRLAFTFPESGDYIVRARTFAANTTGAYSIDVATLPPPPPPPAPIAIQIGQTVQGSFTEDSPSYGADDPMLGFGPDGRHYALYTLTGSAGQSATVTLRSTDFDSYLEIGADTPLGFAVAQSNDDMAMAGGMEGMMDHDHGMAEGMEPQYDANGVLQGMPEYDPGYGGSLDSQLTVTFQSAGTITIRAATLGAGTTGAYTLSVE